MAFWLFGISYVLRETNSTECLWDLKELLTVGLSYLELFLT